MTKMIKFRFTIDDITDEYDIEGVGKAYIEFSDDLPFEKIEKILSAMQDKYGFEITTITMDIRKSE